MSDIDQIARMLREEREFWHSAEDLGAAVARHATYSNLCVRHMPAILDTLEAAQKRLGAATAVLRGCYLWIPKTAQAHQRYQEFADTNQDLGLFTVPAYTDIATDKPQPHPDPLEAEVERRKG